ncbi:DUF3267 domain-containing protein [Clostridium sp.]|uniref:DUF3267 domain-containing protein n=1 Tax=Clostridium sp. TaxID=1506 RepID=UPI003217370B
MDKKNIEKQKRIESYESNRLEMLNQGFNENIGIISILKANLMAFITAAPIVVVCFILYMLKWNTISFSFEGNGIFMLILYFPVMAFFFAIHEVIHGISWSLFCKDKWKSIHLGVVWEKLTPYCHCKEPLKFGGYIFGGLMPLMILGIGLFAISYFIGSGALMFISLINILGAGGDITIALMLLKYRDAYILDHPTECGFIAFTKN